MDYGSCELICLLSCDVILFNEGEVDVLLGLCLRPLVINWQFLSCVDRLQVGGIGIDCRELPTWVVRVGRL